MNRSIFFGFFLILLSTAVVAQTNPQKGRYSRGMMGPGMMGLGMMGNHGMGMCPFSAMGDVKVTVTETKDGATVTYVAKDKNEVARIHKMTQIMKLSNELDEEQTQKK